MPVTITTPSWVKWIIEEEFNTVIIELPEYEALRDSHQQLRLTHCPQEIMSDYGNEVLDFCADNNVELGDLFNGNWENLRAGVVGRAFGKWIDKALETFKLELSSGSKDLLKRRLAIEHRLFKKIYLEDFGNVRLYPTGVVTTSTGDVIYTIPIS